MTFRRSSSLGLASLAVGLWAATEAIAAQPIGTAFTFQGQLKRDGAPVGSPNPMTCDFNVGLWTAAEPGGTELGMQTVQTQVKNGLFTLKLNEAGQFGPNAFNGDVRWLEIQVSCPVGAPFEPLGRQEISATPYALRAAAGGPGSSVWQLNGSDAYYDAGNVGIGITDPMYPMHIRGGPDATSTGGGALVVGATNTNIAIDSNEIMARVDDGSGGLTSGNLILQRAGGQVRIGDQSGETGRLGVNTVPESELHVLGGTDYGGITLQTTDNALNQGLRLQNSGGAYAWNIYRTDAGTNDADLIFAGGLADSDITALTERMRIKFNGQVGIGTPDPQRKLHVNGSIRADNDIDLHNNGIRTIKLEPDEGGAGRGGAIHVYDGSGNETAKLDGDAASAGRLDLFMFDGTGTRRQTVSIRAEENDGQGARVILRNSDGQRTVQLDGESADEKEGNIQVGYFNGTEVINTVSIDAIEGETGAAIKLRNRNGDTTIELDAESGVGGNGRIITQVLEITGADVAEKFPVSGNVEPGMVVEIDPANPGKLRLSRNAYNRRVAGVVSGAGGLSVGAILGNLPGHKDAPPIALSGRAWVQCDTSNGPIEPGDLLTTSDTPGHAMRVTNHEKAQGAILGKAMTALSEGAGLVLVLVSLQ